MMRHSHGTARPLATASPMTLGRQTERRLHRQIDRALRHTYAATTGLRILVGLSTRELLAAGASREQIRTAFVDSVRSHPLPQVEDASARATLDWQREMLINSMLEWSEHVCGRYFNAAPV
jgi:hypothetical protein